MSIIMVMVAFYPEFITGSLGAETHPRLGHHTHTYATNPLTNMSLGVPMRKSTVNQGQHVKLQSSGLNQGSLSLHAVSIFFNDT